MSEPSAKGTQPDATAAPEPPEEPPGVRAGELGRGRLADHDGAGSFQPLDNDRATLGHPVFEQPGTACRHLAPGRREILYRKRDAFERARIAGRQPLFGGFCRRECFLGVGETKAVEGWVDLGYALE